MTNTLPSTPLRQYTHQKSSKIYSKQKRQQSTSSPFNNKLLEGYGFANKSIISIKRSSQQMNEKNERIRFLQSKNSQLEQKISQYERQKQGLENTLNERVNMYTKIIKDNQQKSQLTLKSIEKQFKLQITLMNQQKQQQQRFYQQQSQLMKQKIYYLQNQNNQLQQKVSKQLNLYSDLTTQIQKLKIQNNSLNTQYNNMINQKNIQINKLQDQIKTINQQFKSQKISSQNYLQSNIHKYSQQIKHLQSKLQNQIKNLQSLRHSQNIFKDNQITQLKRILQTQRLKFVHTLQAEKLRSDHIIQTQNLRSQKNMDSQSKKVMEVLHAKQTTIDMLNRDIIQLQNSLSQSNQDNSKLKDHIDQLRSQLKDFQKDLFQCTECFNQQKNQFISMIQELKQQIRLNQLNYVREKDRNQNLCQQNIRLQHAFEDRQILILQITELRQLLMQSSKQIQICRDKFVTYERQNSRLMFDLQKLGADNNNLLRVRRDLQQQAIKWRQSYLRVAR